LTRGTLNTGGAGGGGGGGGGGWGWGWEGTGGWWWVGGGRGWGGGWGGVRGGCDWAVRPIVLPGFRGRLQVAFQGSYQKKASTTGAAGNGTYKKEDKARDCNLYQQKETLLCRKRGPPVLKKIDACN